LRIRRLVPRLRLSQGGSMPISLTSSSTVGVEVDVDPDRGG
jgi:hypothetical protein